MNLIHVQVEKRGKHRRVSPQTDRAAFVVAKAQMRREMAPTDNGLHRAIENINEPFWIFAVGVAAHRRFVDSDLRATGPHEGFELGAYEWKQSFR